MVVSTVRPKTTTPTLLPQESLPAAYAAVMTLNADARELLGLIAGSPEPVAPSTYFHTIHPPNFDASAAEDDPRREVWVEKQIGLYGEMLKLHEGGLIRIVHPSNGERGDLMEVTEAGHAVLA
ncbi:hypothetical protein [Streptomyces sp. NPDC056169]|uniref:hypothetical protein n=1 Tax=Streptomyces sp. NPDC056169 TaxID=3345734 RepID=UPI0035D6ECB2